MAKKKKTTQPKEQSNSGIVYSGRVEIDYIKNGHIYKTTKKKNAGTIKLFEFICNCLTGTYNDNNSPKWINIFSKTGDRVNITPSPVKNPTISILTDSCQAILHFMVPGSNLITTLQGTQIALFNNSKATSSSLGDALAVIQIEDESEIIQNISIDTTLNITWIMTLQNK